MNNNELLAIINSTNPPDIIRSRQYDQVRQLSAYEIGAFSLDRQQIEQAEITRAALFQQFSSLMATEVAVATV